MPSARAHRSLVLSRAAVSFKEMDSTDSGSNTLI
jgi:hypothetical protein